MADVFSPKKRSEIMRRIKGGDTSPELLVRSYLHKRGFRFRIHRNDLPGKPDIVLPKYKTIVFVHGCFWHQHPDTTCTRSTRPKSRQDYWIPKLNKTVERDLKNKAELIRLGWRVLVIWECQINTNGLQELENRIKSTL